MASVEMRSNVKKIPIPLPWSLIRRRGAQKFWLPFHFVRTHNCLAIPSVLYSLAPTRRAAEPLSHKRLFAQHLRSARSSPFFRSLTFLVEDNHQEGAHLSLAIFACHPAGSGCDRNNLYIIDFVKRGRGHPPTARHLKFRSGISESSGS